MNTKHLPAHLLIALFEMAQADQPANMTSLADYCEVSRPVAARALSKLVNAELVRAETLRLTFPGLMKAIALRRLKNEPSEPLQEKMHDSIPTPDRLSEAA
ncbi:MAG: hypothetical protein MK135_11855 [Polyangiaceae bacterium]|nr:hypothetical protein [Polyangiaceae bacterium]